MPLASLDRVYNVKSLCVGFLPKPKTQSNTPTLRILCPPPACLSLSPVHSFSLQRRPHLHQVPPSPFGAESRPASLRPFDSGSDSVKDPHHLPQGPGSHSLSLGVSAAPAQRLTLSFFTGLWAKGLSWSCLSHLISHPGDSSYLSPQSVAMPRAQGSIPFTS